MRSASIRDPTNFTGTKKVLYEFTLDDLLNAPAEPLRLLRAAMEDPESLKRTLTKLYNQRPGWLDMLHEDLDRQVLAAYRLPDNGSDDDLLAELLKLNLARAAG